MAQQSTWTLLCEPFLDVDDPEGVALSNAELGGRGIVAPLRTLLRAVLLTGLWWNHLWFEDLRLRPHHFVLGWVFNLLLAAIVFLVVALRTCI
jgi:hypothetical protein